MFFNQLPCWTVVLHASPITRVKRTKSRGLEGRASSFKFFSKFYQILSRAVIFWVRSNICGVNLRYFLHSVHFRKKLRYFLQNFQWCTNDYAKICILFVNSYNSANIFGKKVYILALLFARRKKYRKYLRYILQNAKINEKNCGIFCRAQKILQKLAQIFAIYFADCKN